VTWEGKKKRPNSAGKSGLLWVAGLLGCWG
jgi:hypothetical protein